MAENKNYKIKVHKSEDENKNRKLYQSTSAVLRKWLAVCSDVNEHGNKNVYEQCLVQAFNLTEFVMDNYIEEVFNANKQQDNLQRIPRKDEKPWENGTYRFIEQGVVIDFYKLIGAGYGGKIEIIKTLGVTLPKDIDTVRKNRNKYAHGTDTYKNSTREELDDFNMVRHYMNTLGELLVSLKKLPAEMIEPSYEDLKLQVGGALGHGNKYAVLGLVREDKGTRLFEGRNGKTQKEIYVKEIMPRPGLLDIYQGSKDHLMRMVGNGIVRTEDVILKNKACYIVTERVAGIKLYDYLKLHQEDNEIKKDLLYQIKKIATALEKYPNVCSGFHESDFVVDTGGDLWLTQYEFGRMQLSLEEILRRYELILAIEEEKTESEEPEQEITDIELEKEPEEFDVAEVIEENAEVEAVLVLAEKQDIREKKIPMYKGSNDNDWLKLCYTIGACGGILLILWALSGLLV